MTSTLQAHVDKDRHSVEERKRNGPEGLWHASLLAIAHALSGFHPPDGTKEHCCPVDASGECTGPQIRIRKEIHKVNLASEMVMCFRGVEVA